MIVALAGGVGGAKLAKGLANVSAVGDLALIVNTADDFEHLGLHISPDVDTVMYWLASLNDAERGWGRCDETWRCMAVLESIGADTWFRLGDGDLAIHIERTRRLRRGDRLSVVTADLCRSVGVRHVLAPMTDDSVRTVIHTCEGTLEFQEYFVRRRAQPRVSMIDYLGAAHAQPSEAARAALSNHKLDAIIICPSNPYLSIEPILAIPGYRTLISRRRVPAVAVSPIVGGTAIKGPLAKMMREFGEEPSPLVVARIYGRLIDGIVIDSVDETLASQLRALGVSVLVTGTVMNSDDDRSALAQEVIAFSQTVTPRHVRD